VMEMTVHQVVDMVAMRNSFVTALGTVLMLGVMAVAFVAVSTLGGILCGDLQAMLVHVAFMQRVQVTIVKIIDVVVVLDRGVSAVLAVFVRVVRVCHVFVCHGLSTFQVLDIARYAVRCRDVKLLRGMCHAVEDEIEDMLIGKKVDEVFPVTPPANQVFITQHAKPL
jgi:hypothetical protein